MSYRITFALDNLGEDELAIRELDILLQAHVEACVLYLAAHPEVPLVGASGVGFAEYPTGYREPGEEEWQDVPSALENPRRAAGSRELVSWRVAELRRRGIDAKAILERRLSRSSRARYDYRSRVLLPDGTHEDPGGGWRPILNRMRIVFVLDLFNGPHERPLSHATLRVLLRTITAIDVLFLLSHPETPSVYMADVRYEEEPPKLEDWQDIPTCLRMKTADCDDLAPWRTAEIVVREREAATTDFQYARKPDGSFLYHIVTRRPNGRIEDPSRARGMR